MQIEMPQSRESFLAWFVARKTIASGAHLWASYGSDSVHHAVIRKANKISQSRSPKVNDRRAVLKAQLLDTDSSIAEPTDCSVPNIPSVLGKLAPGGGPSEARSMWHFVFRDRVRTARVSPVGPQGPFHHTHPAILPTTHNYLSVTVL